LALSEVYIKKSLKGRQNRSEGLTRHKLNVTSEKQLVNVMDHDRIGALVIIDSRNEKAAIR